MANPQTIIQSSYYTGNAALGGRRDIEVLSDPSAFEKAAAFTFQRDKFLVEKKEREDNQAADELGRMLNYDPHSDLKPYSDDLATDLNGLQKYIRDNPGSLVYDSNNPKPFMKRLELENKFRTKKAAATANDVRYNKLKKDYDLETDPEKKSLLGDRLKTSVDDLFSGGIESAYDKQISIYDVPKQLDYELPDLGNLVEYDALNEEPNAIYKSKIKFLDIDGGLAKANLMAAGFMQGQLDENSDNFKRLSPTEQKRAREDNKYAFKKRQALINTTDQVNGFIGQFAQQNPNKKLEDIKQGTNETTSIIASINGYNDQIDQLNDLILVGKLKDKTGRVIRNPINKIDYNDGVSPAELILLKSLDKSGKPLFSIEKSVTETNDAIEYQRDATDRRGQNLSFDAAIASITAKGESKSQATNNINSFIEPVIRISNIADSIPTPTSGIPVQKEVIDQSVYQVLGLNPKPQYEDGVGDKVFLEKRKDGEVKMRIERGDPNDGGSKEYITQSDFIRKVPGGFGLKVGDNNSQTYFDVFNQFADAKRDSKDFNFSINSAPTGQQNTNKTLPKVTLISNDVYDVGGRKLTKQKLEEGARKNNLSLDKYIEEINKQMERNLQGNK